jgi:pimeloyl-ACP methyl ester carboxylesterase
MIDFKLNLKLGNMIFPTTQSGKVLSNGIELYYETFGQPQHPAILLIMGLDAQCVMWSMRFIEPLVTAGYYVIRFDNRDIGLSTWMNDTWQRKNPYTLEDMAQDTVGLLDALHIAQAHVVGASMGGMIAQRMAISHPEKVLSLTSIMSSGYALNPKTGKNAFVRVLLPAIPLLVRNVALKNRFTYSKITPDAYVETYRRLAGPRFVYNESYFRELYTWSLLERKGQNPNARMQQFSAIAASGSRLSELAQIQAPTLVIHGTADPLVPLVHAKVYAPLIPNAQTLWLEGIGHELPNGILPEVHEALLKFLNDKPIA